MKFNRKWLPHLTVLLLLLGWGAHEVGAASWYRLPFGSNLEFTPSKVHISVGTGAPTRSEVKGSLYLRKDGDADTTLYVNGSGSTTWKAFAASNPTVTTLTGSSISATALFGAGNGAVDAPSYTFTSDNDSGLYRIGANNIGIAANGAKVVDIATTGVAVTGTLSATTTITGQFIQAADTTQTLAGSGSLVITAGKAMFRVAGSGGAVTGCTMATGTTDGKTITVIGSSDSNTVQFADGVGLNLGAATRTLGAGDTLRLIYNTTASEWDELSFTNN